MDIRQFAAVEIGDQAQAMQSIVTGRMDKLPPDHPAFPVALVWLVSAVDPAFGRSNLLKLRESDSRVEMLAVTRDLIAMIDTINRHSNLGLSQAAINRMMADHPMMNPPVDAVPQFTQNADGTRTVTDFVTDSATAAGGLIEG